ncbi:MAG: GGDEF domain-containing protein [Spirochaetota bacterium]
MSSTRTPPADLYRRLVAQGIPQSEIESVYRKLRRLGYGDADAKRRLEASIKQLRRGGTSQRKEPSKGDAGTAGERRAGETAGGANSGGTPGRRMEDWFPAVPPRFRRRVNRWAKKNRLAITGARERWRDMLSVFFPSTPDSVNPRLIELLARRKHYLAGNPYGYSLYTTFEALYQTSRMFLGRSATRSESERAVAEALSRRDPFAFEYLNRFAHFDDSLKQSLVYLELNADAHKEIEVAALSRVTKETYRLALSTELVPRAKVDDVLYDAGEVLKAAGKVPPLGLDDASAIFKICLDNVQRFAHELYPVVLKAINAFYPEEDRSSVKLQQMYEFLDLKEDEVLTVRGFYEQEALKRERMLAEQQRLELEKLEMEKEAGFSRRFEKSLDLLGILFPDSDIEHLERPAFLIPYFDERVFTQTLAFDHGPTDVENVAAGDPIQPLLVMHRIIDNLLNSMDEAVLEKVLMQEKSAAAFTKLKDDWAQVYTDIFSPYLKLLAAYKKGLQDEAYKRSFVGGTAARSIEEQINQLRNQAIRNYGQTVVHKRVRALTKLWELAEGLANLFGQVGQDLNLELPNRKDPIGKKMYAELAGDPIFDYARHSEPGGPEFKPVTRQLKRYIEAKHRRPVESIPRVAQLLPIDVLHGIIELYAYLTNSEQSFLRAAGRRVVIAGEEERKAWSEERAARGGAGDRLQIRLAAEVEGDDVDALTGLKTKNFFLEKLPAIYKASMARKPVMSVLMIDIDHFKWVNDSFGHQKGDEVLHDAAGTLIDGIRRAQDIAIRYGGEELMIVTPAPLTTAVVLAERLRFQQAEKVALEELYAPIHQLTHERGEPCGTFSVGVAQAEAGESLEKVMHRADKALYESKQTRNNVTVSHAGGAPAPFESYVTYAARSRKAGQSVKA